MRCEGTHLTALGAGRRTAHPQRLGYPSSPLIGVSFSQLMNTDNAGNISSMKTNPET